MRIGLFSDTFVPNLNGVANSTGILYRELRRQGHDVYVVATRKGAGLSEWNEDHTILRLPGIEIKQLYGYAVTTPIHMNALNEIRKLNLEVIHCQTEFCVGMFAHTCAKQLGIPLVCTYHTTYEDYTHYANFLNSENFDVIAKKAVAYLSRIYGDSALQVIAPSSKTRDLLLRYKVRSDIEIIPTGLELDQFNPKYEDKDKTRQIRETYHICDDDLFIVYVGRIAEEKALSLVVEGFAEAHKQGIKAKLLIVGDGPDANRLRKEVEKANIGDTVMFAGPKPASEVADYYRAADAFASASLSETQGMTFIEAMASGLPLFARRDIVLENLLLHKESGYYFTDAIDLATQLNEYAKLSVDDRNKMKQRALELVQPYSSDVFAKKAVAVYQKAIEIYENMYVIDDVKVKNDEVELYLDSPKGNQEDIKLLVSLDDYYNEGMRKGGKLSLHEIEELKKKETSLKAYAVALRKLTYKDRTIQEIKDILRNENEYTDQQIGWVVSRLQEKGYLDDERYVEDNVSRLKLSLYGEEHIIRALGKKGIHEDTVREVLAQKDDEYINAERYANKIANMMQSDSLRMKKNKVKMKLMQRGYSSDISNQVVESLDFSEDIKNESEHLKICALKAKKKYSKKYSGTDLRNHVFRYCSAKGYQNERIYAVIDEMEWDDD